MIETDSVTEDDRPECDRRKKLDHDLNLAGIAALDDEVECDRQHEVVPTDITAKLDSSECDREQKCERNSVPTESKDSPEEKQKKVRMLLLY